MEIDALSIALRLIIGVVIGFTIGLTGIGGGVLGLPALILALGMPPALAVGTVSLYVFLTMVIAAFHHIQLKNVNLKAVFFILLGAIPANIIVAGMISHFLESNADDIALVVSFQSKLKVFIIIAIFISALFLVIDMVANLKYKLPETPHLDPASSPLRLFCGVLAGIITGGLIGATSVGCGVLLVPVLMFVFRIAPARTVGSSSIIGLTLTAITSAMFSRSGNVDHFTALIMTIGSFLGVFIGARITVRLPQLLLKKIILGIILIAAIAMLAK